MDRRLAAVAVMAVAGLSVLSACGGTVRPAATVDDTEIAQQDVVDELEAVQGNQAYLDAAADRGLVVLGDAEGAFDSAFVATQLQLRIQYAIVSNEVRRRGLVADDACRASARGLVAQQLAQLGGDGEEVLDGFDEGYAGYLVDREADVLLLQGDLVDQPCVVDDTDAAARAYYDDHQDEFEEACASHILVDTLEEAEDIEDELAQGADFSELAEATSSDPGSASSGGELPCGRRGDYVAEFDAAIFSQPVGEVGEPVRTSFGYHVILVTSRDLRSFDEALPDIQQALATEVQDAFFTWFTDAVGEADVLVDPRYGTWDPTQATVERQAPVDAGVEDPAGDTGTEDDATTSP